MFKSTRAAALGLTALSLWGCLGTDVGNPAEEGSVMRFEVDAPQQRPGVARQALEVTGGATITRAELGVRSVSTRGGGSGPGCSSHSERAALEDLTVTLIASGAGTTTNARLDLEPGTYCQLRVTLSPVSAASVSVSGQLADGRAFSITSRKSLRRIFTSRALSVGAQGELLIAAVDVDSWIDADALARLDEAPIVIDERNHRELLARFEHRVRDSLQIVPDLNRNGRIDPPERDILTSRLAQASDEDDDD